MRLLHTETLTFEEFYETSLPRYAILSHRWGEAEVSYKDMVKKRAKEGPGLTKVKNCCKLASSEGYEWVWIDTCCIDKKSSAEVSEAVNAMYRWYEKADKCYAYLFDVKANKPETFRQSSWFTRGWTLQELIAPMKLLFYDAEWLSIGSKTTLVAEVTAVTGIDQGILRKPSLLRMPRGACIARKMYWASARQTSVPEDKAYCLLGLFDINMPLLYGEGAEKAFLRLQKELLSTTTDETIFAWTPSASGRGLLASELMEFASGRGLLASEPRDFAASHDVKIFDPDEIGARLPWAMTNMGFQFTLTPRTWCDITPHPSSTVRTATALLIKLRCAIIDTDAPIVLTVSKHSQNGRWRRKIKYDLLTVHFPFTGEPEAKTIYIVP